MKVSRAQLHQIIKEEIDRLIEESASDITAPPGDDNTAVDPEWSERQLQAQEDDDIGYLHSVLRGRETRQRERNEQFEDWLPPGRFPSAPDIDPYTKKRSHHGHRIKPVGKSRRPAEHPSGLGAIAFEYVANEHPEPLVLKLLSNAKEMKVYENLRKVLTRMPKEIQRRFATIYDMGYVWTDIPPDDPDEPRTIKGRGTTGGLVGWMLQEKVAPLGESYVQLGQLGKEWYSTFGVGDWATVLHNITTNEPYARRFLEKWLSARVSYGGKIPQRSSGPKGPEHYTDKEEDQFASAVENFIGQLKATIPQSEESIRKQMRSYPGDKETGYIEKVLWPPLKAFSARIPIPKSMKDEILHSDFSKRDAEIANTEMLSAFPVGPKEQIKGFTHEKLEELGVGSLLRALELFKEKSGFSWSDLHGANIGIRPSTKELVVLDAGHVRPPSESSPTGTEPMAERWQHLAGIILK